MKTYSVWYTWCCVAFSLLFIIPAILTYLNPADLLPQLFAGFKVEANSLEVLAYSMASTNTRNIAIGILIIYFALCNKHALLAILSLRLLIECFDLLVNVYYNPTWISILPVFIFTILVEVFLISKGRRFSKATG